MSFNGSANAAAIDNSSSYANFQASLSGPGVSTGVPLGEVSAFPGDSLLIGASDTFTSNDFTVTVGQAFTINLGLSVETRTSAGAYINDSGQLSNGASSAQSDFFSTLTFVTSGPVFNLPAGYTVNSIDGNIVDNQYVGAVVPVPAAVWLFGSGLIGLIGLARRKTA